MSDKTQELVQLVNDQHKKIMTGLDKTEKQTDDLKAKLTETEARLSGIEQELVRRPSGGGGTVNSVGASIIKADAYKQFVANGGVGKTRIQVEHATITTDPASAGALVPGDRSRVGDPIPIQRTRLTVRDVLGKGTTTSSPVYYTKQSGRTNNAATVTEGAAKPESAITFSLESTSVKVIATWLPASRQILADAPRLKQFIDTELTWMVKDEEEQQILFGNGVGENLDGIVPQATAFVAPFEVEFETRLDSILQGIAQAQQSKIAASAVIINDLDWARLQATKNAQGDYIGTGPFGPQLQLGVWNLPVVPTPAMTETKFLVGAFDRAVELIDRQQVTILMSDSHDDFFVKNMIAILAEERVALAVKIPEAIVFGSYPQGSGT